ncbi:TolC family protein [Sphingomonas suaedae]|uniref:TolC family protein n=1 Tax=Sphingomonas suaedae TaxID=2599297 RepID=A0A518RIP5_9SPHN|nr:TolC family protein [Sphingomonas suaedae]QDX27301.1 TolC family protein [Sphingomonas suaedae]
MLAALIMIAVAVAPQSDEAPLTLDQAITEAQANAPMVAEAEAEGDAAVARTLQARAAGLPTATASGSLATGRLDPGGFFGLGAADVTPRAAQVSVEQPLFTGGRVGAVVDQARAGERAAASGLNAVRAGLAADVADAYGGLVVAEEQEHLYAQLVTVTQGLLNHAQDRFDVGDAPRTDVSQAKARLAEARAGLAQANGQALVARARLARLIGRVPGTLAPLPPPPDTPATLEDALLTAHANNPAIARAQAALDGARAAERGARANGMPTLGAFADASSVRDQFFPGYRGDSVAVGVRLRWQFFDGGRTRGRASEAEAGVRAARARLDQARAGINEAVTAAFATLSTAALVEVATADRASAAVEAAANISDEVRVGQKPQIDLLDAEREALAARTAALQARALRVAAAYRLRALMGNAGTREVQP